MALEDDIRTLGETPMLDQLGRDAQRLIAFSADRVRLGEGDVLFREGDRADSGYVVVSGAITLARRGVEKRVGRASLIGELALIADAARPATATAAEPTEVLRIARGLFARLFDEYPDLARKLHARIAARLQADIAELQSIEALLRK
ncbi:cyclic nucleotide-binding domain-containing protein [Hansschlegelia zhihuaiae]|uniref:Cyclic nucleotide-binding domain-containing protein n=1 Tax=Hansschlegelia zhihuaiae TaxID=405005 RepID=A0A4Q0M8X5_9HYPH|nr:cyclic nucleotide-binding domain-containing protein [Hansschlegelia zhihuaiae]RXF69574.1 cyclic nucleotide-binding domain-containing protein [Hansschlegelia zhihuaiae]